MDPMQKRIDSLERERWLYRVLVLLAVVAGLLAAVISIRAGGAGGAVVRASNLELADAAGKRRAQLALDSQGQPALEIFDVDGKRRTSVGLSRAGEPELRLHNADGNMQISLGIDVNGFPVLQFYDAAGKRRQTIGLATSGNPRVQLFEPTGRSGVTIQSDGSVVTVSDSVGKEVWRAPADGGGS